MVSMEQQKLFGTNGIRGIVNRDLTPDFVLDVAKAIGTYIGKGKIVIGRDTRFSGEYLKNIVASTLISLNIDVIDLNIAPTPSIQLFCKKNNLFGIIITASHNPPEFNGIKCIDSDGTELSKEKENEIESIFYSKKFMENHNLQIGNLYVYNNANEEYISEVISKVDLNLIKSKKFKVVVDCSNGASFSTTPELLRRLGCSVVTLNANPDGYFSGHYSEPRPENLKDLITLMRTSEFDLGVAHDGDADRAIFVDNAGNFIYGDKTLALVTKYMLIEKSGIIVTPVSTSSIVEEMVNRHSGKIVYTRVGAPIVSRTMIENGALFGGEENGGLIFPEHQYCRDGAMALAKILEIMAVSGKDIKRLIEELPKYYQAKDSVKASGDQKEIVLKKLAEKIKNKKIDLMDGLKIYEKEGWVLIRPSGTEDIIRIYSDAKSESDALKLKDKYKKMLSELA
jgi:phosphomannomutase/phosphoglucomutase